MNSIKGEDLEPKKNRTSKTSKSIFKISLSLALIAFVLTMTPASSFFQVVKPAMAAGTLKSVAIMPTSNIVNQRATYDILFGAATTGTIKTILMVFPSGFDVSAATRLIERSGISSGGSLSTGNNNALVYTLNSAESVSAGKGIRLEIGRIMNPPVAGNYKVEITTLDESDSIIDGPTLSGSFPIKDITGNDVSPNFMIKKTLNDDTAGHAHGWNPDGMTRFFTISDSDAGDLRNTFISATANWTPTSDVNCPVTTVEADKFTIDCGTSLNELLMLHYMIITLPSQVVTSSSSLSSTTSSTTSSTISSPFSLLGEH